MVNSKLIIVFCAVLFFSANMGCQPSSSSQAVTSASATIQEEAPLTEHIEDDNIFLEKVYKICDNHRHTHIVKDKAERIEHENKCNCSGWIRVTTETLNDVNQGLKRYMIPEPYNYNDHEHCAQDTKLQP